MEKQECMLTSSWESSKDLVNCICIANQDELETSESDEDNSFVNFESCTLLSRPANSEEPCFLKCTLANESVSIVMAKIVSEARIVETYGHHEEYVSTTTAQNLEEIEDMKVNTTSIKLPGLKEVSFKLAGLKGSLSVWLYGLQVVVKPTEHSSLYSPFNLKNIDERLKSSNVLLTDRAEKCRKLLDYYLNISNKQSQEAGKLPQSDLPVIMKIIEDKYLSKFNEARRDMSKCISNLVPMSNGTSSSSGANKPKPPDLSTNDVRLYVDNQLALMEKRLNDNFNSKLEELEARQEERMDRLMKLLETRL